jgi:20S proteasome subunit beta 3
LPHSLAELWSGSLNLVQSIFEYNGSAIIAMAGKECVAIGSDLRFGVQLQTLACDYKKIYRIHDQLFLGLAGLGTDAETL